MNFETIFEKQTLLDNKIRAKGNANDGTIKETVIALLVEVGELANELRSFKHWSQDQEPRSEKALEEWADCLHFIASIGLHYEITGEDVQERFDEIQSDLLILVGALGRIDKQDSLNKLIFDLFQFGPKLLYINERERLEYFAFLDQLIMLGLLLGFDFGELEDAYHKKNNKNLERQENGY